MNQTIYLFSAKTNIGELRSLSRYRDKVVLIVNTASQCGFTKQYAALQELYDKFKDKGFEILAFPCNQFFNQEPGDNEQISNFCKTNYGVTFQLFDKIDVNGSNAHPLFKYLADEAPGILGTKMLKWNFTKFLIDKNGNVIKRYSPATTPDKIEPDILKLLE